VRSPLFSPLQDADPSDPPKLPESIPGKLLYRAASPVRFIIFAFLSFHPNAMPWLSRANYARELRAAFFLPWAIAATEGGVIGFIVRKLYEGVVDDTILNYFAGALIAAPALANITSFLWAIVAHGKRKIPFITTLQLGILISIAMMSLAPRTPAGLVMLVAAAYVARILLSGIVTVRATVWGVNYPAQRAKVTGKVQTVTVTITSLIAIGLGLAMQYNENAYRIFIPIGGLIALAGVSSYARIRLRTERIILKNEQELTDDNNKTSILSGFKVLKDDKDYRAYQICQLLIGFGNIMSWAPFVIIAKQQFDIDYFWGIMLTQVIPLMMMPFTIPLWAKLLDSVHIVQFRAIHSWIFVASMLCALVAGQANILWLLFAASVFRGIAFGGGALAWNLGHLQFVKADKSQDYMSIHVTLTGLRGLTAPFVGVALYNAIESRYPNEGSWTFAATLVITTAGALGFYYLYTQLVKVNKQ
jgi:Major Facilitator Superfamily